MWVSGSGSGGGAQGPGKEQAPGVLAAEGKAGEVPQGDSGRPPGRQDSEGEASSGQVGRLRELGDGGHCPLPPELHGDGWNFKTGVKGGRWRAFRKARWVQMWNPKAQGTEMVQPGPGGAWES